MLTYNEAIQHIEIKHNLVSTFMASGFIQSLILFAVIQVRVSKKNQPVQLIGWLLLCLAILGFDAYLCYTGLMKYVIWANDGTEVFVLLLGPILYLFLVSLFDKKPLQWSNIWPHLFIPVLFLLSQLGFLLQGNPIKLNAYLNAYYPSLGFVDAHYDWWVKSAFRVKDYWRYLMLSSLFGYVLAAMRLLKNHQAVLIHWFWPSASTDKWSFSKNAIWVLGGLFVLILIVFLNYDNDLGDHYISIGVSVAIHLIAIFMLSESRLFEKSWIADKYETSGFKKDHSQVLGKVTVFLQKTAYFLRMDCNLKGLAQELNIPPNYISQAINQETQQNFNEFINYYRIEEAKKRLLDEEFAHMNIAGIGQSVGFKSKASFYNAFKKFCSQTPTAYIKSSRQSI